MKRLIIYYSLSGNTDKIVKNISKGINCDLLKIETVKAMPKSYILQIVVGGGQVLMDTKVKIKPIEIDLNEYDEIFIGTPIWNGKCVPAISALLENYSLKDKVTGLIITSGSGKIDKCLDDLNEKLPSIKYVVSLLDNKQLDYILNDKKIENFIHLVDKNS